MPKTSFKPKAQSLKLFLNYAGGWKSAVVLCWRACTGFGLELV